MICRNCYQENADDAKFCAKCGQSLVEAEAPVDAPVEEIAEAVPEQPGKKDRVGMAVASFVLSLVSVIFGCCCGFGLIGGLLSLIFGFLGINSRKKGLAITGVILGAVALVIGLIFTVAFFMNGGELEFAFNSEFMEGFMEGFESSGGGYYY